MGTRLQDKVAVITGAGGAIGSDMARLFASEGAAVAIADILPDAAAAVASEIQTQGGKALAVPLDITSASEVDQLFRRTQDQFGGLDILVNNAMDLTGDTTIVNLEEAAFDHTIAVCLKGAYLC